VAALGFCHYIPLALIRIGRGLCFSLFRLAADFEQLPLVLICLCTRLGKTSGQSVRIGLLLGVLLFDISETLADCGDVGSMLVPDLTCRLGPGPGNFRPKCLLTSFRCMSSIRGHLVGVVAVVLAQGLEGSDLVLSLCEQSAHARCTVAGCRTARVVDGIGLPAPWC